MLPNHAPLVVAERFKVLEALFPGRIDLGLGRAPGTDPITSVALRRRQDMRDDDDFLERFQELMLIETRGFPEGHPFRNVRAMPADVPLPPIYLLGSSGYSAELAAAIGAGFAFAHHFATHDATRRDDELPRAFQAVARAGAAARHPGGRGGRGRHATRKPSASPPRSTSISCADEGRIPAAGEPGGSRRPTTTRRSIAQRIRQRRDAPVRRRTHDRAGAPRAVDRRDPGGRGDGHHHDLRSRGAPAFLRADGAGVRARRVAPDRRACEAIVVATGNLFADIPARLAQEEITTLMSSADLRIERIVSRGQSSPPGFWYDQPQAEWVIVLAGCAELTFEGDGATHADGARRPCAYSGASASSRRMDRSGASHGLARRASPLTWTTLCSRQEPRRDSRGSGCRGTRRPVIRGVQRYCARLSLRLQRSPASGAVAAPASSRRPGRESPADSSPFPWCTDP